MEKAAQLRQLVLSEYDFTLPDRSAREIVLKPCKPILYSGRHFRIADVPIMLSPI
jgi:hypothetical protein